MKEMVLLDTGPLAKYSNPKSSKNNDLCKERVDDLISKGVEVRVPEIADYEVRRELLLCKLNDPKSSGVERLDAVIRTLGLLPLTSKAVQRAAALWAQVRHGHGKHVGPAIDADVLIAAQALVEAEKLGRDVFVATSNSKDFRPLVKILDWDDLAKP